MTTKKIIKNKNVINVALYVMPELAKENQKDNVNVKEVMSKLKYSSKQISESYKELEKTLKEIIK